MIQLGQKSPAPNVLARQKVVDALVYLRKQLATNKTISSKDFSGRAYWGEVKKNLSDYQHGKCCFCERGRDSNGETDVEHFRPKNAKNGKPAHGHNGYWWLAYNWDNLFFVCKECNSKFKGNKFPLVDEATRANNEADDLGSETPVFFCLIDENPEDYISYDWVASIPLPIPNINDVEMRAKKTIDILGLAKRTNLAAERSAKLKNMELNASSIHYCTMAEGKEDLRSECIERLKAHTNSRSNYAGFARYYYKSQKLGQYIDD